MASGAVGSRPSPLVAPQPTFAQSIAACATAATAAVTAHEKRVATQKRDSALQRAGEKKRLDATLAKFDRKLRELRTQYDAVVKELQDERAAFVAEHAQCVAETRRGIEDEQRRMAAAHAQVLADLAAARRLSERDNAAALMAREMERPQSSAASASSAASTTEVAEASTVATTPAATTSG